MRRAHAVLTFREIGEFSRERCSFVKQLHEDHPRLGRGDPVYAAHEVYIKFECLYVGGIALLGQLDSVLQSRVAQLP